MTGMWVANVSHPEEGWQYETEVYADTLLHAVLKLMANLKPGEELQDVARRGTAEASIPDVPATELLADLVAKGQA